MTESAAAWCMALSRDLTTRMSRVEVRKPTAIRERVAEIDIWIDAPQLPDLERHLARNGFQPLRSLREGTHRFLISSQSWGWCKVDAKLRNGETRNLLNWLWALRRRRGAIVALVGADGAGKSSAITTLSRTTPFGTHVAYMGTRRRKKRKPTEGGGPPAPRSSAREVIGVGVWLIKTMRRLLPVHKQARLGRVVICDRHPIEIEAVDGSPSRPARILRRFIAGHLLPAPDHIFLLAAPGEVLYERKGEHSPERLDDMTTAFRSMTIRRGGTEIDATASPEAVVAQIEPILLEVMAARG